jgi:hypothetical protein
LLEPSELFSPGDPHSLAAKIEEVVEQPESLLAMSARNLTKAMDYHIRNLRPRRRAFYEAVWTASERKN